jgi:tRNA pseudouridine55 synthase
MSVMRVPWRAVDGVLLLDKPAGISSNTALQKVRRLFLAAKGGHSGTLDPMATGLLPICLGEATKYSHLLLGADKRYLASVRLGVTTTTGDLEGEIVRRVPVSASGDDIEAALSRFRGPIQQTPPMYSAIKQGGQPLYKLARAGREVPRAPRSITIHSLTLEKIEGDHLQLDVRCSKGTYVRVLAEDIGNALGCGACLAGLRREGVGRFTLSAGAVTFEHMERLPPAERDTLLLPADELVAGLPRLDLDAAETLRLIRGQSLERAGAALAGLARIYGPNREFLGVVEVTSLGHIVPRRLRAQPRDLSVSGTGIC